MKDIVINEDLVSVVEINRNLHLKESDRYTLLSVTIQWKVLDFVDRNKNDLWELLCAYDKFISEISIGMSTYVGTAICRERENIRKNNLNK